MDESLEETTPHTDTPPTADPLIDALALLQAQRGRNKHSPEYSDHKAWMQAAATMCRHCRDGEDVTEAALRIVAQSREWYVQRVQLLEREQQRMRDPERTLVCDILANGQLLPDPDGSRYGQTRSAER